MRKILKPLRYVFFRVLAWKLRSPREPTPVLAASLVTCVLLFLNVLGLTMAINIVLGRHPVLPSFPGGRAALGALFLGCALVAHNAMSAAWAEGEGYAQLLKEFERDPRRDRIRTALFWIYVVAPIGLPLLLAILWFGTEG